MMRFDVHELEWTREPEGFSVGGGKIRFGIYACSPEDPSFKATFTDMPLTACQWKKHDGQCAEEDL